MSWASAHGHSQLKNKNCGWVVIWRRGLNSPTFLVQAPTLDPKLTDRHYWIYLCRSFACALFYSQMKPGSKRKLYPARKRINSKSRCQGFTACSTQILYCKGRRMLRMSLRPMCANIAAGCSGTWNLSEWSQLQSMWAKTVNFQVTTQEFCKVGGYTEDLEKLQNCQIEGWALAWRWALAQDNMVFAYHLHL